MTPSYMHLCHWRRHDRFPSFMTGWTTLLVILAALLPSACTRFSPADLQRNLVAEQMAARLKQTNAGLTRFKCVAKMTLAGPNRKTQTFRAALAGQLSDRLRIDMFAPFGGSAGSVSSDGKNLFLVMHPSREYYKKRFGSGNLRRMIQIDITVGDLLEMLVGRIPMDGGWTARLITDELKTSSQLAFVDRWGRTRQRIIVDDGNRQIRSEWFDGGEQAAYSLVLSGRLVVDGFVLPERIELSGAKGERVMVMLDRYEANVRLDDSLFVLTPPPS